MKIAIIGYGKMGKAIERIAIQRGHTITSKFTSNHSLSGNPSELKNADVAIEFSKPDMAINHIDICINNETPVVVGTTGWNAHLESITANCISKNASLLHASNFSVGVNIFFEINKKLAQLMHPVSKDYKASMEEIHHTEKLDSPSGTAITLAQQIIENSEFNDFQCFEEQMGQVDAHEKLPILAKRIKDVPGTHIVSYESSIDQIEIKHTAKNRDGFALGAVIAAEWIINKKGVFTMSDVLDL